VKTYTKDLKMLTRGGLKQGGVGKIRSFLSLGVNISKTAADTAKVTIN